MFFTAVIFKETNIVNEISHKYLSIKTLPLNYDLYIFFNNILDFAYHKHQNIITENYDLYYTFLIIY